jgi:hypothetical protein
MVSESHARFRPHDHGASPPRSPRNRPRSIATHVGDHLLWMADAPPDAAVGVSVGPNARLRRGRTPPALDVGSAPQPVAGSASVVHFPAPHAANQFSRQASATALSRDAFEQMAGGDKVRFVAELEADLLRSSLERDRTNDSLARVENQKLRTQAELARRDALREQLGLLNQHVHHVRAQLRNIAQLQR